MYVIYPIFLIGLSRTQFEKHWLWMPFTIWCLHTPPALLSLLMLSPQLECLPWPSHCRLIHTHLFFFFNFTILYWFCHLSTWIRHRYTRVPHPEPSSLLPPRTIRLSRPSAPAPSIQYRASNLDWRLVSYMILYMCSMPFSQIIPPFPSPRVHKTVLYIFEDI